MNASHVTGSTYSGQFSSVQFVCCEHNTHNHSTVGIGQTLRGVALCTKPIFGPGAEPPAGGAQPPVWARGRSPLKLIAFQYWNTHFCAVLELAVAADLTEATRPRRTFDTAAILSVND